MKSKLRLKATGSSIINSTPPFANTMLPAVFILHFTSQFSIFHFLKYLILDL